MSSLEEIKYNNLIDTHAHLQYDDLFLNRKEIVENSKRNGIKKIIVVGTNLEDSKIAIKLSEEFENLYCAVGVHPNECNGRDEKYIEEVISLSNHDKCVAIGEIGLDYYRDYTSPDIQKRYFDYQLSLAEKLKLPVIIHVREAFEDSFEILKNHDVQAVFHCFSGDLSIMERVLKEGYMLSFTGSITYGLKKGKSKMEDVVKNVPLDRFMLETDSPYLSPEPVRGKKNNPLNIIHIASAISKIKGISPAIVEESSSSNSINFFRL